jgi:hypothetical protein
MITARGEWRGGGEQISAKEIICAAPGSPLARALLTAEIEKFPPRAMASDNLQARAPGVVARAAEKLYGRWLEAHQLNVNFSPRRGKAGQRADQTMTEGSTSELQYGI